FSVKRRGPTGAEQFIDRLAHSLQVRVDAQSRVEGEERTVGISERQADLCETADRAVVARLELQRAVDAGHAFLVPALHVIERGTLVPGFGEIRVSGDEPREDALGRREIECGESARRA